ncbi:hypothetical protein GIY21_00845 [Xanthomonas sontii]|uniref:Uncharacterized protein n=1 Tax=Xanthomonas sontii TaxID=2650745 RepID=A0A6N7Q992_9XANT|nr:hypothetical protein [Xanthomonas sontii]MRG98834.1 hypothetical protein [Xanthomonas sontii]MRH73375.1 hypothetical protein [Xanthomonas sontii]
MSLLSLAQPKPQPSDRAWAAYAAVYLAARRLRYSHRCSIRAARAARASVLAGRTSAAGAIAKLRGDLRATARSRS